MIVELDPYTALVMTGIVPWLGVAAYCLWNRWIDSGPADNE